MGQKYNRENPGFGIRIKQIRESLGLTQKEFASRMKLSPSAICEVEAQIKTPGLGLLTKLFETFSISINYVMFGIGNPIIGDTEKDIATFDFGDQTDSIMEILSNIEKSMLFRFHVIAHARHFLKLNPGVLEADIEYLAEEKQKKQQLQLDKPGKKSNETIDVQ